MTADTKRYLDEGAEAQRIEVSRRTLQRWRAEGNGPPYIRAGLRRILYDPTKTDEWLASRTFPHRAAELAQRTA
ncbi:helix-turn-helix transcriptional regulator [Roseomonas sp. BN140053]|uniref:helix-turn-helix transcriptional regulator n=1 Tax=Roseomonas sp. BN140053 TaxID=3391898 RepID=UPI0039E9818F